jgi:hypothetical protein
VKRSRRTVASRREPPLTRSSRGKAGPALPARLKQVEGLHFNELEDGCVVYTPDRHSVHHLNASAALVLELCSQRNSVEEIVDLVREAYSLRRRPADEVHRILAQMLAEGLLAPAEPARPRAARKGRGPRR